MTHVRECDVPRAACTQGRAHLLAGIAVRAEDQQLLVLAAALAVDQAERARLLLDVALREHNNTRECPRTFDDQSERQAAPGCRPCCR
jgi:hypothetical protein